MSKIISIKNLFNIALGTSNCHLDTNGVYSNSLSVRPDKEFGKLNNVISKMKSTFIFRERETLSA